MKIVEVSVRRPVLVSVVFVVVLLFGIASLRWLPIDMFPDIEMPVISVITVYKGASAEDIEEKVTKVIEDSVGSVENLDEVTSTSQENISVVTLKFNYGADLGQAAADIRQGLEMAKINLPEDIDSPMLFQMDVSKFPVMVFAVVSDSGDVRLLRDYVEDNIFDPLERVPGVGSVVAFGVPEFQLIIEVNRDAMKHHGLSLEAIKDALQAENFSIPAGTLEDGVVAFTVRMPAEFRSVDEVEHMIVRKVGDSAVRLGDVAFVRRDIQEVKDATRIDGLRAIAGGIMKQSDANIVDIADGVEAKMTEISKTLPPDLHIIKIMDSSRFIRLMINNLFQTLLIAMGLVVLVVLLFLRRFRSSLIIAMSLPMSLIIVFFGLYAAGYTLNIISMMALILGIGMVVDNAIVVLESITRKIEEGVPRKQAAIEGTREVGGAIMASTLTTISIFGPMIFISGLVAQMFGQLAFVMSLTIGASLFVALTLTPSMGARLLRPGRGKQRKAGDGSGEKLARYERAYRAILRWSLSHRTVVLIASISVAATTFYFISNVGFDFMPATNQGEIQMTVELPLGTGVKITTEVSQFLSAEIKKKIPEVEHVFFRAGASEQGMSSVMGGKSGSHIATIMVRLKNYSERTRTDAEIQEVVRGIAAQRQEIVRLVISSGGMSRIFSGGDKPLTVEVQGADLEKITSTARQVEEVMGSIDGAVGVTAEVPEMMPEIRYTIDRDKAAKKLVLAAMAGVALRTALNGDIVGRFRGQNDDIDIMLRYRPQDRVTIEDLKMVTVRSLNGASVRLGEIGTFDDGQTPLSISRKNKERLIKVGGMKGNRALGDIENDLDEELAAAGLDHVEGVSIGKGGDFKQQKETFEALIWALILGILLVFLVMAAQFESYLDPFIIFFSIPFAFTGSFLLLLLTHQTLSLPSFLGLIVLVGVVVNNAIVLVDYANLLRREKGMDTREAIITAGTRRLRPVLMTAMTTVFGLAPMAIASGEGSGTWKPLGIAAVGGLSMSTVVTLVLIPVLYSLFDKLRVRSRIETATAMK